MDSGAKRDPGSVSGAAPSLKATVALAVALLVVAGAFDLGSLYVPGLGLLVLAAGAAAWAWLASRGAAVERSRGPATVTEGEPYPVRIRVRGGLLPPRGELLDPLLRHPLAISILGRRGIRVGILGPGVEVARDARFDRRGRHPLPPGKLVIRDPLGLCSRVVEGSDSGGEVLVLPRVEPVLARAAGSGSGPESVSAGEGSGRDRRGAAGIEIDGLRPYRRGSPASRIHWPAVARHGELVERRLESGADEGAVVVLDAADPAGAEALDRAVRAAASLCVDLARRGGCTLVVSGSARPFRVDPKLRGWLQVHARLALVEPGGAVPGSARLAHGSAAFWVTAAAPPAPPRRLPRGSCLVSAHPPPAGTAEFTVAGCYGVTLGSRSAGTRARRAAA